MLQSMYQNRGYGLYFETLLPDFYARVAANEASLRTPWGRRGVSLADTKSLHSTGYQFWTHIDLIWGTF